MSGCPYQCTKTSMIYANPPIVSIMEGKYSIGINVKHAETANILIIIEGCRSLFFVSIFLSCLPEYVSKVRKMNTPAITVASA
jgi:hypothetical protein